MAAITDSGEFNSRLSTFYTSYNNLTTVLRVNAHRIKTIGDMAEVRNLSDSENDDIDRADEYFCSTTVPSVMSRVNSLKGVFSSDICTGATSTQLGQLNTGMVAVRAETLNYISALLYASDALANLCENGLLTVYKQMSPYTVVDGVKSAVPSYNAPTACQTALETLEKLRNIASVIYEFSQKIGIVYGFLETLPVWTSSTLKFANSAGVFTNLRNWLTFGASGVTYMDVAEYDNHEQSAINDYMLVLFNTLTTEDLSVSGSATTTISFKILADALNLQGVADDSLDLIKVAVADVHVAYLAASIAVDKTVARNILFKALTTTNEGTLKLDFDSVVSTLTAASGVNGTSVSSALDAVAAPVKQYLRTYCWFPTIVPVLVPAVVDPATDAWYKVTKASDGSSLDVTKWKAEYDTAFSALGDSIQNIFASPTIVVNGTTYQTFDPITKRMTPQTDAVVEGLVDTWVSSAKGTLQDVSAERLKVAANNTIVRIINELVTLYHTLAINGGAQGQVETDSSTTLNVDYATGRTTKFSNIPSNFYSGFTVAQFQAHVANWQAEISAMAGVYGNVNDDLTSTASTANNTLRSIANRISVYNSYLTTLNCESSADILNDGSVSEESTVAKTTPSLSTFNGRVSSIVSMYTAFTSSISSMLSALVSALNASMTSNYNTLHTNVGTGTSLLGTISNPDQYYTYAFNNATDFANCATLLSETATQLSAITALKDYYFGAIDTLYDSINLFGSYSVASSTCSTVESTSISERTALNNALWLRVYNIGNQMVYYINNTYTNLATLVSDTDALSTGTNVSQLVTHKHSFVACSYGIEFYNGGMTMNSSPYSIVRMVAQFLTLYDVLPPLVGALGNAPLGSGRSITLTWATDSAVECVPTITTISTATTYETLIENFVNAFRVDRAGVDDVNGVGVAFIGMLENYVSHWISVANSVKTNILAAVANVTLTVPTLTYSNYNSEITTAVNTLASLVTESGGSGHGDKLFNLGWSFTDTPKICDRLRAVTSLPSGMSLEDSATALEALFKYTSGGVYSGTLIKGDNSMQNVIVAYNTLIENISAAMVTFLDTLKDGITNGADLTSYTEGTVGWLNGAGVVDSTMYDSIRLAIENISAPVNLTDDWATKYSAIVAQFDAANTLYNAYYGSNGVVTKYVNTIAQFTTNSIGNLRYSFITKQELADVLFRKYSIEADVSPYTPVAYTGGFNFAGDGSIAERTALLADINNFGTETLVGKTNIINQNCYQIVHGRYLVQADICAWFKANYVDTMVARETIILTETNSPEVLIADRHAQFDVFASVGALFVTDRPTLSTMQTWVYNNITNVFTYNHKYDGTNYIVTTHSDVSAYTGAYSALTSLSDMKTAIAGFVTPVVAAMVGSWSDNDGLVLSTVAPLSTYKSLLKNLELYNSALDAYNTANSTLATAYGNVADFTSLGFDEFVSASNISGGAHAFGDCVTQLDLMKKEYEKINDYYTEMSAVKSVNAHSIDYYTDYVWSMLSTTPWALACKAANGTTMRTYGVNVVGDDVVVLGYGAGYETEPLSTAMATISGVLNINTGLVTGVSGMGARLVGVRGKLETMSGRALELAQGIQTSADAAIVNSEELYMLLLSNLRIVLCRPSINGSVALDVSRAKEAITRFEAAAASVLSNTGEAAPAFVGTFITAVKNKFTGDDTQVPDYTNATKFSLNVETGLAAFVGSFVSPYSTIASLLLGEWTSDTLASLGTAIQSLHNGSGSNYEPIKARLLTALETGSVEEKFTAVDNIINEMAIAKFDPSYGLEESTKSSLSTTNEQTNSMNAMAESMYYLSKLEATLTSSSYDTIDTNLGTLYTKLTAMASLLNITTATQNSRILFGTSESTAFDTLWSSWAGANMSDATLTIKNKAALIGASIDAQDSIRMAVADMFEGITTAIDDFYHMYFSWADTIAQRINTYILMCVNACEADYVYITVADGTSAMNRKRARNVLNVASQGMKLYTFAVTLYINSLKEFDATGAATISAAMATANDYARRINRVVDIVKQRVGWATSII